MKKAVWFGALCFFVFGIAGSLPAVDSCCAGKDKGASKAAEDKSAAIDVGNKICPVTGEKINEKTKATYQFEGKIYNFCCSMCIGQFKKDPERYIKKIEEEKAGEKK